MFESRYRRFVAARMVARGDVVSVFGNGVAEPATLSADEMTLAQMFDGQRSATQIVAAALQRLQLQLTPEALEGFAARLVRHGLLRAGADEPLPPTVQTYQQAVALGWTGQAPTMAPARGAPPTTVPGTMAVPGLLGGLTGLVSDRRGDANRLHVDIDSRPLVWLGRSLIWPLRSAWALCIFLSLLVTAAIALFTHRYELIGHVDDVFSSAYTLIGALLFAVMLVNLAASAARAAAVYRYTPETVRSGLLLGWLWIPKLFVDTAGAAEHSQRPERLRIIGSGMVGVGALAILCVLLWFLFGMTHPSIASASLVVVAVCVAVLILNVNPLTRRDGYYLLSHLLDTPDLREQAVLAVFGRRRPWFTQQQRLSKKVLLSYIGLNVAFWVFVVCLVSWNVSNWLVDRFAGNGFLVFSVLMGAYMYRQFRKAGDARSNLGWKRNWMPSKTTLVIAAVVFLLCLVPYRYEPSGEFVVLPNARADIRALVDGDVREVLVQEGDLVSAGDVIARLSGDEERAKVAAAEAEIARLNADLALAQAGGKPAEVDVARQRVETARKRSEVLRASANRLAQAYKHRAVTTQEYERALGAADVADEELIEAERSLDLTLSAAADDRIVSIKAQIREAEVALEYSQLELKNTEIRSPIDGQVVSSVLRTSIGNFLHRGELLATVEDKSRRMIEIKLPETGISEIEIDSPSFAKLWAYPGTTFRGMVTEVAPAAEKERYGNVVRVYAEVEDPDGQMKSGMTGNAKVRGGWHLAVVVFTRAIVRFLFVEVWSWLP